ncbi:MAG: hypothetical protein PUC00_12405 [Clostridiales bacterium]|nr:hypothetical protein [Clostridiales bacterium]
MKERAFRLLRTLACVAGVIGWAALCLAIRAQHCASYPALYAVNRSSLLLLPFLLLALLLLPAVQALVGLRCGYSFVRLSCFCVEITRTDRLRLRWRKQPAYGAFMLPPRTDGASPYGAVLLSPWLLIVACTLLAGLLMILLRQSAMFRTLLLAFWASGTIAIVTAMDTFSRVLAFHRSRDLRRAWECGLHISAGLEAGGHVEDMPEAWFLPYPEALADHPLVRLNNFNRAARLIDQQREQEAYGLLQHFLRLEPGRQTYPLIAAAILNGAFCEALAGLPPRCLNRLEDDVLKMPLPPQWEYARLLARYARALFLRHDEAEAAAILPALETEIEKQGRRRAILVRLQEKAGLLPQESNQ